MADDLRDLQDSDLAERLEQYEQKIIDDSDECARLLNDLQLHQVELEIQNRELHEAQQALEAARDDYADLYDFAPVGYLTLDRHGRILKANLTVAEMLSRPRGRLLGQPLSMVLARNQSQILFTHLRNVFTSTPLPQRQRAELSIMSGTDHHTLLIESAVICDRTGEPTRPLKCRSIVLDVTEQRTAEQAQRDTDAQMRAVIEATHDGFWMIDADGRLMAVNNAYVQRSGYSRDELLRMRIDQLDAAETPGEVRAHIKKVQRVGHDVFETLHRTRDGKLWPVEISATYSPNEGGIFFAFTRDISERRRLQQEIIDVSTMEQERIGHEIHDGIGQQLCGLAMLAEGIQLQLADRGLASESASIAGLHDQLLSTFRFARLLARGLAPVEIDPGGLATALDDLAERTCHASRVNCRYVGSRDIQLEDQSLALHLFRIAQEAVSNALRHAGPTRIEIDLQLQDGMLVLTVLDDGVGIGAHKEPGDGIGMHIMQYRARIMQGHCAVTPAESGGTMVRCVIPIPEGSNS